MPRTLVVDDCRVSLLLLKHLVGKLGVGVDTAADGDEALSLLEKRSYPLIFLDVMLPTIDGFEVCRQIRSKAVQPSPRVYFLTALGEAYSQEKAEKVGADGVFFKPIVPSQIAAVVKDVYGDLVGEGVRATRHR